MRVIRLSFPNNIHVTEIEERSHVMAIGDFDGLHLGHQKVIGEAVALARSKGIPVSIMTFDPHPREVLGQTVYSRYLAPLNKKLELFADLEVDYALVVQFDTFFSKVSAEDFVSRFITTLNVDTIVVGFDFRFGHKAKGTVDTLKDLSADQYDVKVIPAFQKDNQKVSSTLIRGYLQDGKLTDVKNLLGRHYVVTGKVVHGDGRGRTIGFPTANMELTERYVVPKNGVYAVRCTFIEAKYEGSSPPYEYGVMNIGVRPTFDDNPGEKPKLEVHLLDFSGDVYGQTIKVELIEFIRDERKFDHVEALIQQIHEDVKTARQIFNTHL